MRYWIGRWRDAAAEAAALGLDVTSARAYRYWQHNIELPEEVTTATRWFDTAEKLAKAVDTPRLVKFARDGERHIWAVEGVSEFLAPVPALVHNTKLHKMEFAGGGMVQLASTASDQVQAEKARRRHHGSYHAAVR